MSQRPGSQTLSRSNDFIDTATFFIFVAGLAWCPFWFGGNAPFAWGVNAIIFPLLAIAYEVALLARGKPHPYAISRIAIPAGLFIAAVIWIVVQNQTWVPGFLRHPIWGMTADVLQAPAAGSISVNRDLTELALTRLITAATVFWLALQLCRDGKRANNLLRAIAAICAIYAAFGLAAFAIAPGFTLWVPNKSINGFVTSTFYNKNSFGAYAGVGLVTTIAITMQYYRQRTSATRVPVRYRLAEFIDATGTHGAWMLSAIVVLFVSLLMTVSRGALVTTVFATAALGLLSTKSRSSRREQWLTILIGTLLLGSVLIGFGDAILDRLGTSGLVDSWRMTVAKITVESALSSPLLGYGYGTFVDVFPMFRDGTIGNGHWEMAHNTYAEVVQGLGLVFGIMLIASVLLLVIKCLTGATTRQAGVTVPRAAVCVSLLVGTHSLVDFSLQIQAIALTFAAILGAGVAQSESSRIITADS